MTFDLLTPSPGSREVGEGGGVGEGKVNIFSFMLGHPTLYWASSAKFPTDHKSRESSRIDKCKDSWRIVFFQSIRDVLRFSYEIG